MPKLIPKETKDVIQILSGDGYAQQKIAKLTCTSLSFVQKTLYQRGIRAYEKGERHNRFWNKVVIGASDKCWEWRASKNCHGYGRFKLEGRRHEARGAHVVAWILTYGQVPHGLCVLRKCDNPGCVNPNHLFLGTQKDNIHDMIKKGRHKHKGNNYGR